MLQTDQFFEIHQESFVTQLVECAAVRKNEKKWPPSRAVKGSRLRRKVRLTVHRKVDGSKPPEGEFWRSGHAWEVSLNDLRGSRRWIQTCQSLKHGNHASNHHQPPHSTRERTQHQRWRDRNLRHRRRRRAAHPNFLPNTCAHRLPRVCGAHKLSLLLQHAESCCRTQLEQPRGSTRPHAARWARRHLFLLLLGLCRACRTRRIRRRFQRSCGAVRA